MSASRISISGRYLIWALGFSGSSLGGICNAQIWVLFMSTCMRHPTRYLFFFGGSSYRLNSSTHYRLYERSYLASKVGETKTIFFVGAVLSTICLFFMPNSSSLWMAAGLLWILDTAGNIAMEPFRAFVADKLSERQRTQGFAMQSLMIGLGGSIASALPWLLANWLHVSRQSTNGSIPDTVKFAFYIGGSIFL